jgi:GPH family glycoside/pentoside/hexuronide:cation symporter
MFLSILPAVGAFISFLFIAFYPLSEKRMKGITKELEARRAEKD